MNKKIEVRAVAWEDIIDKIPRNDSNKDFIDCMNGVSIFLKPEKKDYVYLVRYEYGDKLIEKGSIPISQSCRIELIGGQFKVSQQNFEEDILYSSDPLGMVLTNYIEIYTENKSIAGDNGDKYTVPLDIINAGDLFGVFGLLDHRAGISSADKRDWNAIAGDITFSVAWSFKNDTENKILEELSPLFNKADEVKHNIDAGTEKVKFIKKYISDWPVEVIYIPIHYFRRIVTDYSLVLENYLLKKGWIQSVLLRYSRFEDSAIANILPTSKCKLDIQFLNLVYNYILRVSRGEAKILKPLKGQHLITMAIDKFKKENEEHFTKKESNEPLPFIYERLKDNDDWGIVSVFHLPIESHYKISTLNQLIEDLKTINNSVRTTPQIKNQEDYRLPFIKGFGRAGSDSMETEGITCVKPVVLRSQFISHAFSVPEEKVNLEWKEFANLIFVKRK